MNNPVPRPLVLVILDGWGYREDTEANAIAAAKKPNWDHIWNNATHTLISGSGKCVGLPEGQMGNSEVGHLNMGAGRIVQQDLTRIDSAIQDGDFFHNKVLLDALDLAKKNHKAVHVMGLLSPGGVHSHENHILAMVKLAKERGAESIFIHPFLDGRDTPPKSALASLKKLNELCQSNSHSVCRIVSLIGRYYAMDRDKRWERIQPAYELLISGKASFHANSAIEGLEQAYARGETDEFVQATTIGSPVTINDGDVVFFMNFRSDRARELTEAFMQPAFNGFDRKKCPKLGEFVCLSEYDKQLPLPVAFSPQSLDNILGAYLSEHGFKQLRIAETEKYAHVTFFFNGGIEKPFPGEDRILIPSPKVATYDLQPEMSAPELTETLLKEIKSGKYDLIICNYANPDMVGHTGNLQATVQAIEIIDECLGKIVTELKKTGGELLITADHGNAELMYDKKNLQPHTAHTSDPVPFIYVGRKALIVKENAKLSDIAPTILYILKLPIPSEMTGTPILTLL